MLLNDKAIRDLCLGVPYSTETMSRMIEPFSEAVSGNGIISYGLSSAGYDIRLGPEILVFKNSFMEVVDPKRFHDVAYRKRMFDRLFYSKGFSVPEDDWPLTVMDGNEVLVPPHGYVLGSTYERFSIPRHLSVDCLGKSTYARCGVIINVTPLEPGWRGYLTVEISNSSPCPVKLFVMEGLAQLRFHLLTAPPEKDYAEKGGKYQNQQGVTPAKVL